MNKDYTELIEYLGENFHQIDKKFNLIDEKLQSLSTTVSHLPTKSYLDNKVADFAGGLTTSLRKEDQKVNRLTEMLHTKNILSATDVDELKKLQIFPR